MTDETTTGELGSLAQSARTKELKSARGILIFVGAVTVLLNIGAALASKSLADAEVKRQVVEIGPGMVDPASVEEARTTIQRAIMVAGVIFVALGIVYILLGLMVYKFPVPITIAGLVLYVGSTAVTLYLNGGAIGSPIAIGIKAAIAIGLFKAVQAAIASEREGRAAVAAA